MSTIQQATARKVTTKHQEVRRKEQPRPKKRLKAVDNKKHHSKAMPQIPFPVFVISVSVITAGMMINVAQQALVSQLSFQVDQMKKDIQIAQQAQDSLRAQKALLESPERVESVATGKLSMVKTPRVSYLRIVDSQEQGNGSTPAIATRVSQQTGARSTTTGEASGGGYAVEH